MHGLVLHALDRAVLEEVLRSRRSSRCSAPGSTTTPSSSIAAERGRIKQALLRVGWPAEDLAGYVDGEAHPISLREEGWQCAPTSAAADRSGPAARG